MADIVIVAIYIHHPVLIAVDGADIRAVSGLRFLSLLSCELFSCCLSRWC